MALCVFAPGRVELIGNHTDYNAGVVLSAALELGITLTGQARGDDTILLRSDGREDGIARCGELQPTGSWTDYPLGVVRMFLEAGARVPGFEAQFSTTLPAGSGLSSSAAIEVATAVFLARLTGLPPGVTGPLDLARLCRRAENEYVGVPCGLLDQASSLLGERGRVLHLDCHTESVETFPFLAGAALILVHSGVRHALVDGAYRERRESCFEAAARLGVPALRDATEARLAAARLPDRLHRRAAHILGENRRVTEAVGALCAGDARRMGALMTESHESSRRNFENSSPELDALVEIATAHRDILGARLTGGGFGGSIVALATGDHPEQTASEIADAYQSRSGHSGVVLVCHPSAGAWTANGCSVRPETRQ